MSKNFFDSPKVEELIISYKGNGRDPKILGEIFQESKALINVVASKFSTFDIDLQDLQQEARLSLIRAIDKFDPGKGKTAFSYLSTVFKNAIIDYIRKQKPQVELFDVEDLGDGLTDTDYIHTVVNELREWFPMRFPTIIERHLADEILHRIVSDIMDANVGKREALDSLRDGYGYSFKEAKHLIEVVIVNLRMFVNPPTLSFTDMDSEELTFQPEFALILDNEAQQKVRIIFTDIIPKI